MALQSKIFTTGDLSWGSWSNAYMLDLIITEESVDPETNSSLVSYKLQIRSGAQNRFAEDVSSTLRMEAQSVEENREYKYLNFNSVWTLLSGQINVAHQEDGTKVLTLTGTATPDAGNQWAPPTMTVTGSITLTEIPRASTVAAGSAAIGQCAPITVTKHREDCTHTLAFSFGTLTGYIGKDGQICQEPEYMSDALVLFALPESFYQQIPDAPSGSCTITCTTFLEHVQLGLPQTATFTVTADRALCGPVVSGMVYDANELTLALTGGNTLVQYHSLAHCQIYAQGRYGAQIAQQYINGIQVEECLDIPRVTTGIFTFRAIDTRGYTSTWQCSLPLISYVPLTALCTAKRPAPTVSAAQLSIQGNWFAGNFGKCENKLQLRWWVDPEDPQELPVTLQEDGYRAEVTVEELDYRQGHTIMVEAADLLETVTAQVTVNRGIPVFDWGEADFTFHVPVSAPAFQSPALEELSQRLTQLEERMAELQ